MKYNPSINIEYGIDKDFHYIVTPNAQAVTGELVSNFHSGIHSFSIIGTYGTGKSSYLMALERDLMEGSNYLIQNSTVFGENFGGFECLNILGDYSTLSNLYWQTNFIATDLMILRIFSQHYQSIMLK